MSETEPKIVFKQLQGFPPIKADDEIIITEDFLNASKGIVKAIESFGNLFLPIVYDMNGNIETLEKCFFENTEHYSHIEKLIVPNADEKTICLPNSRASSSLLWLKRALDLIAAFFRNILDDSECSDELKESLRTAYERTLKQYHGWLVQKTFSVIYRFVPTRSTLIGCGKVHDENIESLKIFLPLMEENLLRIDIILKRYNLDDHKKV